MSPDPATFRLRDVAVAAYGPTLVSSTGNGAAAAVLALRARELGAGVSVAALVVALTGVGMLLTSLPAGALVARIGERRALVVSGVVDAVAMLGAALSTSVVGLGAAVLVSGATWTTFLLARQGFMIDAVPATHRARALATLGGANRVGILLGPLLGAAIITVAGLGGVFVLAAVLSLASAVFARVVPDLGSEGRAREREAGHLGVLTVLAAHRRVLLTLGVAVVVIAASRSVRTGLLPLWAEHVGIGPAATSLVFAMAGAVDALFFYPGGWLMDRYGRAVVAVPVVASVALATLLLPLATTTVAVAAAFALVAVGNGLGSGVVMTLGADAAPGEGRSQFLGGWRLCGDIGMSGGPLVVGLVAAVAPLATACLVVGALGVAGTTWVGYWVRRADAVRRAALNRSGP